MRILTAIGLTTVLGLLTSMAQAGGLPLVISATVDYTHNTLTISGQNFGSNPSVTLDALAFSTQGNPSSNTQIVANFPSGKLPASFTPGTYFLTVTFKNQFPTIFGVDIGANGAQGPAGPAGVPGATGAQGATGPAGPAGPQGLVGPMGPPGATGPAGAQGLQGVAGPVGPQGLQGLVGATGATGPQGPAGANGTNGGALVCTTAPNVYLVTAADGTQTCQGRFVDNLDGTVSDNQTGLMWEKKSASGTGDVHDTSNVYSWSVTPPSPDGTLYTNFLVSLNRDDSTDGSSTCFANHCDWRIPTSVELQGILFFPCQSHFPGCIATEFGPTSDESLYWSSTSVAGSASQVWAVIFDNFGRTLTTTKTFNIIKARAVRGGR